jgi:CBS domain containing-hemolysin-like protein
MEGELSVTSLVFRGLIVIGLVAANAFFVAAEFALVAARRTRIDAMVRRGDRKAKTAQAALQDLYRQLSAAQLGITLASILLGYVAEETVASLFHSAVARLPPAVAFLGRASIASIVAVSVVTFLHVVFGEQAPKSWAISHPEATSRWIARPLIIFSLVTRPLTNLLNKSSALLLRLMGLQINDTSEVERIHSPEEIVMLAKQSQQSGALAKTDVRMIEGVFEFTEKTARDVMTPRTDVVALPADLTVNDAADRIATAGRSRYPVYGASLDEIVGMVHAKQILAQIKTEPGRQLGTIVREPLFVPGTAEVEDVLADMKRRKVHLAVVLDEYGGTAGIVTMEDLLEEIVGKIYDEYDRGEPRPTAGDGVSLAGSLSLSDANDKYNFGITDEDYQTIGGYVFGKLGRLPKKGDRVRVKGGALEVTDMQGKRVGKLRLISDNAPKRPDEKPTVRRLDG